MHRQLREGESDTLAIEGVVDGFIGVKIDIPIVGRIHPDTNHHIHAATIQSMESDKGLWRG